MHYLLSFLCTAKHGLTDFSEPKELFLQSQMQQNAGTFVYLLDISYSHLAWDRLARILSSSEKLEDTSTRAPGAERSLLQSVLVISAKVFVIYLYINNIPIV